MHSWLHPVRRITWPGRSELRFPVRRWNAGARVSRRINLRAIPFFGAILGARAGAAAKVAGVAIGADVQTQAREARGPTVLGAALSQLLARRGDFQRAVLGENGRVSGRKPVDANSYSTGDRDQQSPARQQRSSRPSQLEPPSPAPRPSQERANLEARPP